MCPHALFLQARSHMLEHRIQCNLMHTYKSTMVAFFLILSSITIPISLMGATSLSSWVATGLGLKNVQIILTFSLYTISSIVANISKGSITRRIITESKPLVPKLLINDVAETSIIICKTITSKILRILCLYGLMSSCIKARSVLVTSTNTWVVLLLVELVMIIIMITSRQIM